MLVPLNSTNPPPGAAEATSSPGAVTSGLKRSEYGVGPREEKPAGVSTSALPWPPLDAAAEIACVALPGELIEPRPRSPSFPAETAVTTPAFARATITLGVVYAVCPFGNPGG